MSDRKKLHKTSTITNLPQGIDIHGGKLRLRFTWHNRRYQEVLDSPINSASIKYASNKLSSIKTEIQENRFEYARHFPTSIHAHQNSTGTIDRTRTIEGGVALWLSVHEQKSARSTYKGYHHKANHVTNYFKRRRISDISKSEIELFQTSLLKARLSPKSVNDIFTVLRGVFSDAYSDGIIHTNPLDRITNIERDAFCDHADPFTREELSQIATVRTRRQGDINLIMFACWCGLSLSEVIALSWEDIDTNHWTVHVRRARVGTEYKVPKERSRNRKVELIDQAITWLKRQLPVTSNLTPIDISVRQRDNVTTKNETIRLVFLNGKSNAPWHASSLGRWFTGHLKRAGVRHRGPNQCRHTFASQCLSSYVPVEWLARQLGHSDTTMIKRHYGRWIPDNTPSMGEVVSRMLAAQEKDVGIKK